LGRYVFTAEIFDALAEITPGAGGELQLTDAIGVLLKTQAVYGRVFEHGFVDAGQPVELLRANVELALERPDLAPEFGAFLVDLVRRRGLK
jgi:UTP--glucose-1-phosphate uridylyltransferase